MLVDTVNNIHTYFFQADISVNMLGFDDISWQTKDIHRLMSCLCIIQTGRLLICQNCKLTYKPLSTIPNSAVHIDIVQIEPSLTTDTVVALLSHLEVDILKFFSECQIHDVSNKPTPFPTVNRLC